MTLIPYDDALRPGSWKVTSVGNVRYFRCPYGHIMSLDGHTIDAGGNAQEVVACPSVVCAYRDRITLEERTNNE